MYITRIEASGVRHAPPLASLGRTDRLPALPAAAGIADAVRLATVALAPGRWEELDVLGWLGDDAEALTDDDSDAVDMLVGLEAAAVERTAIDAGRTLAVDLSLAPDPPLYGRLREHAIRDPRLVTALGQEAELHVKGGFLLTSDHTGASPDLLGARIGDVSFPIAGKDRPAWLAPLLGELSRRIWVLDPDEPLAAVVARLFEAATSHRPDARRGWALAKTALQAEPFGLPEPQWVHTGDMLELGFGDDLLAPRQLGRAAADALRLVEAALVRTPDVLVVPETLPAAKTAWLHGCTDGDEATLEQVLVP